MSREWWCFSRPQHRVSVRGGRAGTLVYLFPSLILNAEADSVYRGASLLGNEEMLERNSSEEMQSCSNVATE
ncbi:hypothetical protein E2C01_003902 [Portunus trituberculatus]|uniref:Uncharacterized protein n=1 Tax=Portunus trituberculatus TaxID=210409 RepID=A0A5B7CP36_PORTR|nr:hypothetical protein [Portunus trituberculatus]